jgi:hypothetical protein
MQILCIHGDGSSCSNRSAVIIQVKGKAMLFLVSKHHAMKSEGTNKIEVNDHNSVL